MRHIPIPENDWAAFNVWKDEMETRLSGMETKVAAPSVGKNVQPLPDGTISSESEPSPSTAPIIPTPPPPPNPPTLDLQTYSCPWKMTHLTIGRKTQSGNNLQSWNVPVGKIWDLCGYYLKSPAGQSSIIYANNGIIEQADSATVTRSPQYTKGIFLSGNNGDSLQLAGTAAGCSSWARINQFDEDPNIKVKIFSQDHVTPYQVPVGKNFRLTYCLGPPTEDLLESVDNITYDIVVPLSASGVLFTISGNGGVLAFPVGVYLLCSHNILPFLSLYIFGYEINFS